GPVVLEGNGDHDEVAAPGCIHDGSRAGPRSELGDEGGQGLRPSRVADHDVVAVRNRQPGDLASDLPRPDQPDGLHGETIDSIVLQPHACRVTVALGRATHSGGACSLSLPGCMPCPYE